MVTAGSQADTGSGATVCIRLRAVFFLGEHPIKMNQCRSSIQSGFLPVLSLLLYNVQLMSFFLFGSIGHTQLMGSFMMQSQSCSDPIISGGRDTRVYIVALCFSIPRVKSVCRVLKRGPSPAPLTPHTSRTHWQQMQRNLQCGYTTAGLCLPSVPGSSFPCFSNSSFFFPLCLFTHGLEETTGLDATSCPAPS